MQKKISVHHVCPTKNFTHKNVSFFPLNLRSNWYFSLVRFLWWFYDIFEWQFDMDKRVFFVRILKNKLPFEIVFIRAFFWNKFLVAMTKMKLFDVNLMLIITTDNAVYFILLYIYYMLLLKVKCFCLIFYYCDYFIFYELF